MLITHESVESRFSKASNPTKLNLIYDRKVLVEEVDNLQNQNLLTQNSQTTENRASGRKPHVVTVVRKKTSCLPVEEEPVPEEANDYTDSQAINSRAQLKAMLSREEQMNSREGYRKVRRDFKHLLKKSQMQV